jgi:hypothetical protein
MSIAARYVDEFLIGMESSGKGLYNSVVQLLKRFDTNEDGNVIQGSYNAGLINEIAGVMQRHVDAPTYESRLSKLKAAMPRIGVQVTQKFIDKYGDIPDPVMQDAIKTLDIYSDTLTEVLEDDLVVDAIMIPYVNDLFYAMGTGMFVDDVINVSFNNLTEAYTSYFVTKVTVLLEQYERALYQLYSSYFGVKRYTFTGPKDDRNRDWCHGKVGKKYTQKQVQNWASEDWQGKIDGTDSLNIFINLGGYNCRHILEPV